jgi:hypothetical protein
MRARYLRLAFLALAAPLLAQCGLGKSESKPPPRATDTIEADPQSSVIAVPIEADIGALYAALEREVPRTLWTIDKPDQTCVASDKVEVLGIGIKTPKIKCHLVGQVTRGPLVITGEGRNIVVTMPIRATIQARDIAGIIKHETATAAAQVRAIARLDIAGDWTPRAQVTIAYDWTREPSMEILGQRIVFTSKADAKLAGVIDRLERTLPREVAKIRIRPAVEDAWGKAFTSLELNRAKPPVWMRIAPQEVQYGGYSVRGQRLSLTLGLKARTETFVGLRPPDVPPTPLPPLRPLETGKGRMQFFIPVIADYAELEPVILRALAKRATRPFNLPKIGAVDAQFEKVEVYATSGNRIAVGVTFSAQDRVGRLADANGTIWITGTPLNEPDSREVRFSDVQLSGATDNRATNLLFQLANGPELSQTIAQALGQNFTKDYNSLLEKIGKAIEERREGKLLITARIDDIRTGALKATGQGLYLPVWGTGTAAIAVQGPL